MNHQWYEDAVIYHIFAPSLAGAEPLNDYSVQSHRLAEIEKWLGHISKLGCNTVLLSPVMQARSHGYDVTDYFKLDNRLGTNDEFAALVHRFHDSGVCVLLDCVFNHCGRDFFAFKELQGGNRDYAAWFSGVNFNASSPLGDYFTYDTWSGHFSLPKFNIYNPDTRKYLLDAARFWIDTFDIDGMRLDAANTLDFDFMRELRTVTEQKKPGFWLMGEVVHGDYARWVNENTLHSVTNYMLYKALYSSHNDNNLYELANTIQNSQPRNGLPLYNFVDNHDQPRIADNIKNPGFLKTLYALLFTVPGIPSIYYGSEWGILGKKEAGSDAPMRPYIDIDNPPHDDGQLEEYIESLARVRSGSGALKYGTYRQVYLEYQKPFVFERSFDDECVYIAVNIGGQSESVDLSRFQLRGMTDLLSGEVIDSSETGAVTVDAVSARLLQAR